MGISATVTGVGGWTVGPVVGRRPAGVARDAVHPGTGARAVLVLVDGRFTGRGLPDPETVARAAVVGSPAVMPMLDAGLLEDGTRWYVTPASPGPVLDPAAGCSPRRAATIVEAVARGLAAVHAAGLVHGLVGAQSIVPAGGRHTDRPVGTTLLLDAGVAALLGDRADDLAAAAGVGLPADRGAAADVYALGALLLRLLTAAAPAGPALAALPVELRALLSAMLDEQPSRRPTADAVARTLAGLREGLLATGPVDVQPQRPVVAAATTLRAPAAPVPAPAPARARVAPVAAAAGAAASAPLAGPAVRSTPRTDPVPRPVAPVPVPEPVLAPRTLESPIVVPRVSADAAPSLWTGSVPVAPAVRQPRRRGRRIAVLAGGVGLAGLLIGVATHLPLGHVDGDQAVAAVADHGLLGAPSQTASGTSGSSAAATAATRAKRSHAQVAPAAAPAFIRPTAAVPSPLTASATSPTPSRSTTPTAAAGGSGSSSAPAASSSASSSAPTSSTTSSGTASPDPAASGSSSASSGSSSSAPSTDTTTPSASDGTSSSTPADTSAPTDSASSSTPADTQTSTDAPTSTDPAPTDTTTTDPSAP